MTYNIWFSLENSYFPEVFQGAIIGNIVNDRHLVRCLTANFDAIYEFLILAGKVPLICAVKNADGSLVDGYPYDPAEYEKYMQPVAGVDIYGNSIMIPVVGNSSAGWADFYEFPPVIETVV